MIREAFQFIVIFLLLFILGVCIVTLWNIKQVYGAEYQTPGWQKRAINEYNYDRAIHNKLSTTIENDKDAPSWQRRAIDNYNYNQAIHGREKERRNNNDD